MIKDKSYKKANYPNAIPSWRKHPYKISRKLKEKEERKQQLKEVLKSLDWGKLATIGKE